MSLWLYLWVWDPSLGAGFWGHCHLKMTSNQVLSSSVCSLSEPWRSRLWVCVQEGPVPYCGHLSRAPCTSNGPPGRSWGPPPHLRNPKGGSKASSVRRKKTAIGWIFKQLLGHTTLGLPERKIWILPPRTRIQLDTRGCVPVGSKNAPDNPRLIKSLLQGKHDGTDLWMLLWLSLWLWVSSLGVGSQGPLSLRNDLQAMLTSSVWLSARRRLGKLPSFEEEKASTESVFSGLYLTATVSCLRHQTSRPAPRP